MKPLNCCIVCYENIHCSSSSTLNITGECVTARFVQLFQRHVNNFSLESTQIKIRDKGLTFLSGNGVGKEKMKFQACASCSELFSSFNSSYVDLNCAEMKINWGLEQLTNVICSADATPARRTKFREKVSDLEEDNLLVDDIIEIISTFRKQLQNQCRLRYKNQFPRVVLMKPSQGQNLTTNLTKDTPKQWVATTAAAKSKHALISTALKNLSSFQLIICLALFDPSINNGTSVLNTNFEADVTLEQHDNVNIGSSRPVRVRMSKQHNCCVEGSPSSPPSPTWSDSNDDNMDVEWRPGDGEDSSNLDDRVALSKKRIMFPCTIFDKIYSSNRKLLRHRRTVCSARHHFKFVCKTPRCGKRLETEDSLRHHEIQCKNLCETQRQRRFEVLLDSGDGSNEKEKTEDNFIAEAPSGSGEGSTKIKTEYKIEIIQNVTTQSCSSCQFEFFSEEEFQQHLVTCSKLGHQPDATISSSRNVQIKQEPMELEIPANQTKIRRRINIKKHQCKQCGLRCRYPSDLRKHELIHLAPESSCRICGKKFCKKLDLNEHLRTHSGEKQFSEKPFSTQRVSLDEKVIYVYSCSYCGKQFTEKNNMIKHVSIHTRERPFKCNVDNCDKGYARKDHLERHLKISHGVTNTT